VPSQYHSVDAERSHENFGKTLQNAVRLVGEISFNAIRPRDYLAKDRSVFSKDSYSLLKERDTLFALSSRAEDVCDEGVRTARFRSIKRRICEWNPLLHCCGESISTVSTLL
jgi:hypothetical protein